MKQSSRRPALVAPRKVLLWLLGGCLSLAACLASDPDYPTLSRYDLRLCEAVSIRWVQILEPLRTVVEKTPVEVGFSLAVDGSVTNFLLQHGTNNQGGGLLCKKAVIESAPFGVWPASLRQRYGQARRINLRFNFDTTGRPLLAFAEEDPCSAPSTGVSLQEPLAWYLPYAQRAATAAERPWVGRDYAWGESAPGPSGFTGATVADLRVPRLSSLTWPPPDFCDFHNGLDWLPYGLWAYPVR